MISEEFAKAIVTKAAEEVKVTEGCAVTASRRSIIVVYDTNECSKTEAKRVAKNVGREIENLTDDALTYKLGLGKKEVKGLRKELEK